MGERSLMRSPKSFRGATMKMRCNSCGMLLTQQTVGSLVLTDVDFSTTQCLLLGVPSRTTARDGSSNLNYPWPSARLS